MENTETIQPTTPAPVSREQHLTERGHKLRQVYRECVVRQANDQWYDHDALDEVEYFFRLPQETFAHAVAALKEAKELADNYWTIEKISAMQERQRVEEEKTRVPLRDEIIHRIQNSSLRHLILVANAAFDRGSPADQAIINRAGAPLAAAMLAPDIQEKNLSAMMRFDLLELAAPAIKDLIAEHRSRVAFK